jgi:hypothetical protein
MDGSEQMPPQESFQPPQDSENAKHKSRRNYLMKTLETRYDTVAGRLSDGTEIIVIPMFEDAEIRIYRLPTGGAHAVAGLLSLPSDAELLDTRSMDECADSDAVYDLCETLLQQHDSTETLYESDGIRVWAEDGLVISADDQTRTELPDTPENRTAAVAQAQTLVVEWAIDRRPDAATVEAAAEMLDRLSMDTIAHYMDDEIREGLHMELAPCEDIVFLVAYMERHAAKYGSEFVVN